MANTLADVQHTFTSLDQQYNMLLIACKTQADRDALGTKYATAQAAYQTCLGQLLTDDDAEVAKIDADLKAANTEVDKAVTEMGDISKVLTELTTAITLGAQLITKAGL